MSTEPQADRPVGLFGSVRRLIESLAGLVQTRLELISTEIAEERLRLVRLAVVFAGVVLCFQFGILLAAIFLVLAVPAAGRPAAVGIASLVFLGLALAGGLWMRYWLKHRPPFLAATMAEFRKDRDRLRGKK